MKKTITLFLAMACSMAVCRSAEPVVETYNPVLNGFVRQFENDGLYSYENVEVKKVSNYSREMMMDFDLTGLSFAPRHATLRLYCNSVDLDAPFILSAYGIQGNLGEITYTTRPANELQTRTVDIHGNKAAFAQKWIEFDVSDFVKSLPLETDKKVAFRIAVASDAGPLLTFSTTKTVNKPELVLSDTPMPGVYEIPYSVIQSASSSGSPTAIGSPEFALNGEGLLPDMCHTNAADRKAWRTASGALPHWFKVELKEKINLKKFHIWNMNWAFGTGMQDYSTRGVQDMELYVSDTEDNLSAVDYTDSRWTKIQNMVIGKAGITMTYQGEEVEVSGAPDGIRWIGFNIKTNYGSGSYVGISELKIYKENKAAPVGIDPVLSGQISLQAYAQGDKLTVRGVEAGKPIVIYDAQGRVSARCEAAEGETEFALPSGFYVVKCGLEVVKVIV